MEQCQKPLGNLRSRFPCWLGFGVPAAAGEDGGEHGSRGGDDGDAKAHEAILGVAAEGQWNDNHLSGDGRRAVLDGDV